MSIDFNTALRQYSTYILVLCGSLFLIINATMFSELLQFIAILLTTMIFVLFVYTNTNLLKKQQQWPHSYLKKLFFIHFASLIIMTTMCLPSNNFIIQFSEIPYFVLLFTSVISACPVFYHYYLNQKIKQDREE